MLSDKYVYTGFENGGRRTVVYQVTNEHLFIVTVVSRYFNNRRVYRLLVKSGSGHDLFVEIEDLFTFG